VTSEVSKTSRVVVCRALEGNGCERTVVLTMGVVVSVGTVGVGAV
jgi:hypothetical protein